jgi:ATP-dependent DNA helicase RecG
MLTNQELLNYIEDLESDRIERTTSTNDTDKFSEAICAFANDFPKHDKPGYLFIGVNNNGTLSGLQVADKLLLDLAAIRSNGNILPQPAMTVNKYSFPGGELAVVEVTPSVLPPVRFKGRVWIRVGPSKAVANEHEERILSEKRASLNQTFDLTPIIESSLNDLALGQFDSYKREAIAQDIIATNHRTIEEQMASLRFYDLKKNCPSVAGILLFGKNPRYFISCAYVQYLYFPGNEITDRPIDQAEISGDLLSILKEIDTRIKVNINKHLEASDNLREDVIPDYPEWAIREIIMNAIMHRDYQNNSPVKFYYFQDRIEIQNPGGLYGDLTPETVETRNTYRNPVIAEAMKSLGYVNRFGYGIKRAKKLLRDNENPEPLFQFEKHYTSVTIFRRKS